ncbi:hypothetical protein QWY84_10650 [Aquisalimonas lutea]|uniref:terminase small subunit-like protein n=1 Tax=Aquisalimonas lutea TaxID=1327750 RepID=UPI0025B544B2|nr:hypothetical protein [Aquisalimonas lutea]MDN3518069.1 hypothetical protein [Aquisalimonas lutea]
MTDKPIQSRARLTEDKKDKLVELLAQTANLSACCAEVGVNRRTVYFAMEREPEFRERINQARDRACLEIEREMHRRGIQGIGKGVYYKGEKVGEEREYSDKLLMALAKANMPERFTERQHVVSESYVHVEDGAKRKLANLLGVDVIEGEALDDTND